MAHDDELYFPIGYGPGNDLYSTPNDQQNLAISGYDTISRDAAQHKKKGGRKPIYATSEERKQRNRRAQAVFRRRRTEHIKKLEETLRAQEFSLPKLQKVHQTATQECRVLQYKNSLLEHILLEKGVDVQAELHAKTDSLNLGLTQIPANFALPAPVQSVVTNSHSSSPAPTVSISKCRSMAELPQLPIPTTESVSGSYAMQASGDSGMSMFATSAIPTGERHSSWSNVFKIWQGHLKAKELTLESEHDRTGLDNTEINHVDRQSQDLSNFTEDMLSLLTFPYDLSYPQNLFQRTSVSNHPLTSMTQLMDHSMACDPVAQHDYWYLLS